MTITEKTETTNTKNIRFVLLIYGRVTNVGFRVRMREKAQKIGVTGWVKNTAIDLVEAVVEGKEGKVKELMAWTRTGEHPAIATKIDEFEYPYTGEFKDFAIVD